MNPSSADSPSLPRLSPGKDGRRPRALVTGAGGGIGAAIALALAEAGADVALHCSGNARGAEEVSVKARALGAETFVLARDFSEARAAESLFTDLKSHWGNLDILVNNAAWDPGAVSLSDSDEAFVHKLLSVNLVAPLLCIRAAVPLMGGGHGAAIVNIGSVQSTHSVAGHATYAAAKGGLDALTRELAVELGPKQIRVNSVNPGFIQVPRTVRGREAEALERVARRIPLGRIGLPQDVADVVVFLCSGAARYLSGETLTVDGGSTRCLSTHANPMGL